MILKELFLDQQLFVVMLRQRLDVSVNILTNFAVNKKNSSFGEISLDQIYIYKITVMSLIYLLSTKRKNSDQIFNVGYQNMSINEIAQLVKRVVMREYSLSELEISRTKSDDNRSYHINSDKIKYINFSPKYSIENAIVGLCNAFKDNLLQIALMMTLL